MRKWWHREFRSLPEVTRMLIQIQGSIPDPWDSWSVCFTLHRMTFWCWNSSHGVNVRIRIQCLWDTGTIWDTWCKAWWVSHCHPQNVPNCWVWIWWLWKRRTLGTFIWQWLLLEPVPQRKHHSHHFRERLRYVVLTIITTMQNLIAQLSWCFLPWLDFMKLEYTQTNVWTFDLFFLRVVPIMKKKVQSSSSKAGCPRMCNREGQDHGLGEDADWGDGELPA